MSAVCSFVDATIDRLYVKEITIQQKYPLPTINITDTAIDIDTRIHGMDDSQVQARFVCSFNAQPDSCMERVWKGL